MHIIYAILMLHMYVKIKKKDRKNICIHFQNRRKREKRDSSIHMY